MKVLEILRNWRRRSPVEGAASSAEIDSASALLEYFEKELGPGHTALALDCAIDHEARRMKLAKKGSAKMTGEEANQ